MAEIKKGSFTLPGEAGFESLTLKMAEKWGADVIRDSDGTKLSEDITNSINEICSHYGITNIRLRDIDKQWGHPSVKGMKSISEQVWTVVSQ